MFATISFITFFCVFTIAEEQLSERHSKLFGVISILAGLAFVGASFALKQLGILKTPPTLETWIGARKVVIKIWNYFS